MNRPPTSASQRQSARVQSSRRCRERGAAEVSLRNRATNTLDVTRVRTSAYQDSLPETDTHTGTAESVIAFARGCPISRRNGSEGPARAGLDTLGAKETLAGKLRSVSLAKGDAM